MQSSRWPASCARGTSQRPGKGLGDAGTSENGPTPAQKTPSTKLRTRLAEGKKAEPSKDPLFCEYDVICGGGVGNEADVAEPAKASLLKTVKEAVKFSLVLGLNPRRCTHSSDVVFVVVCSNAKTWGIRGSIDKNRREG